MLCRTKQAVLLLTLAKIMHHPWMVGGLGQDTLSTPGASSRTARPCSGSATQMPVASGPDPAGPRARRSRVSWPSPHRLTTLLVQDSIGPAKLEPVAPEMTPDEFERMSRKAAERTRLAPRRES